MCSGWREAGGARRVGQVERGARAAGLCGTFGHSQDARTHSTSKLVTQDLRQPKQKSLETARYPLPCWPALERMPQQLKQDGQLGQLGVDMLKVDAAPLEPIVSSIFRKVRE